MTSHSPFFSVLCATFNQAQFLVDMLESVKGQTCSDFELIVVDDGSTDDTPAVLNKWLQDQDSDLRCRVKIVRQQQSGQSAAWEEGFAVSSGQWICFLDSDDAFLSHKLGTIADVIRESPGVGMIQHPMIVIDEHGVPTGDIRPQSAALSSGDLRAQMRIDGRHVAPGASALVIARQTMERLVPMPTKQYRFAADAYLSFGATATAPILSVAEPLSQYRMQPGGQYLKRMLSAEGLVRQVDFQRTIAAHFGLEDASRRNSFFCRNVLAARRFNRHPGSFGALRDLLRATAQDHHFSFPKRAALITAWTVSALLPRFLFIKFWNTFQMRQTGWTRIASSANQTAKPLTP